MAEAIIKINSISKKTTKEGSPYASIETNLGNFNCFNDRVVGEIEEGKCYKIEYIQKGKYKNLIKIISEANDKELDTQTKRIENALKMKSKLISLGYAIQLSIAEIENTVKFCQNKQELNEVVKKIKEELPETAKLIYGIVNLLDNETNF